MIFRNKTKSTIDIQAHVIRIDEWGRKSTNTIHNFSSTFSFAKQLLSVHIKPSKHCNFLKSSFFKWLFGKLSAWRSNSFYSNSTCAFEPLVCLITALHLTQQAKVKSRALVTWGYYEIVIFRVGPWWHAGSAHIHRYLSVKELGKCAAQ